MRQDFDYIKGACAICLTTTGKGDKFVATGDEAKDEQNWGTELGDMILAIQDDYYEVTNAKDINAAFGHFRERYHKVHDVWPKVTLEEFIRAIAEGYVWMELVIWD